VLQRSLRAVEQRDARLANETAYVANCGGNNRTLGGHYGSHGSPNAHMYVRHHCQMTKNEWHACSVGELALRVALNGYASRPHLYVATAVDVHYFVLV